MNVEEVWKGKVGSLIKDSLRYLPHLIFYMHPLSVSLTINSMDSRLELKKKPGFWKFIPWFTSIVFVSWFWLLFVCHFQFRSALHIKILDVMISIGRGVFAASEMGVIHLLSKICPCHKPTNLSVPTTLVLIYRLTNKLLLDFN